MSGTLNYIVISLFIVLAAIPVGLVIDLIIHWGDDLAANWLLLWTEVNK